MRISLNWLNDYVDIKNENEKKMAEKITRAGVNIESVETVDLNNLVVGEVIERKDHPNSDHLNICLVNLGEETVQIVCGASNVDKGQKVIVAKTGAVLPGDFTIKSVSVRGIESNGMICALYELGLEDKETNYDKGIHLLPNDAIVGGDPLSYLDIDDTVYELDLNPNRNDCLSHLGFAYEVASVLGKRVKKPLIDIETIDESIKDNLSLEVETDNCTMYKARLVKDVVIGESPSFIKKRLLAAGIRSINNVVDISNYIMLEYGQPLHFFDKDKVGNKIVVRMANDGEKVITIDKKERSLIKDDIVITNDKEVIAIAGVMGCLNSEVDETTKNILIESAIFNPYNVRYTYLRLDLRSEASIRFEKGLNYEYTSEALDRACYLLAKYASGKVLSDDVTYDKVDKEPKKASVSRQKINEVLGMNLNHQDIIDAFNKLDFKFTEKQELYNVEVPNRRMDISIREDLIEEVGRLYGYDNIVGKMPVVPIKKGSYDSKTLFNKQVSKRMRSLGLNQVVTYTLISDEENSMFKYQSQNNIKLLMPMSVDKSIIRQSVIPSLLKTVDYNYARGIKDIAIYEISNTYYLKGEEYKEDTKLSIAMLGDYISNNCQQKKIKIDFYLIKGIIENLLNYLDLNDRFNFKVSYNLPSELHPGISAEISINNEAIGYIGAIHPRLSKLPILVGEISLNKVYNQKTGKIKYKEVSKFPSISKDIAFIFDKKIVTGDIVKLIKKTGGIVLENVDVFDVYEGNNIEDNKKSIAFSLIFNDKTKTLTDDAVNVMVDNIVKEVEIKLGGILRSK